MIKMYRLYKYKHFMGCQGGIEFKRTATIEWAQGLRKA